MRKQLPLITGVALVLLGVFFLMIRSVVLDIPISPNRTASSWEVELVVNTKANVSQASLSIYNPSVKNVFRIVDRAFSSDDYSISFAQIDNRSISMFSKRRAEEGNQKFSMRLKLLKDSQFYTRPFSKIYPYEFSLEEKQLLNGYRKQLDMSSSEIARLKDLVERVMRENGVKDSFLGDKNVKLAALEYLDIPSRYYYGIELQEGREVDSLSPYLVTIHAGKTYLYSLKRKEFVPRTSVLLWGSSKDPIANVEGLRITNWTFTSIPLRAHLPKLKQQADSWVAAVLKWYSVNRLSLSTQHSFSVLLLLPLAALMIAFLRNVVGIRTFGTFMPAILSLAFRETGLLAGLLLFIVVVIFGVLLRMSFKYFRLLLVPRLCATLTCVVMLLFGLSIFGANFRIHSLSSLSLFPVVILAMVIERLSIAIDEYGYRKALSTLGLSLVAAALAYLLISYHFVSYLFSAFPELNLSVLGLAILLGRYFGYRLTELVRFKSFADKELS